MATQPTEKTETPATVRQDGKTPSQPGDGKSPQATPREEPGRNLLTSLLVLVFGYLGELLTLLGQTLKEMRRGIHLGDLIRQMSVIGVETVPIALLTIGFTGAVLSLYTVTSLVDYGASDLIGGIVAVSIVREIGPILTGVVVAARAGSAMTAEIGSMKVSEQVDALRAMGISPNQYLVVPRVIASIIMMPMLTFCANLSGIIGGGMVASSLNLSWATYFSSVRQLLDPDGSDITRGLFKTIIFGILIVLVGCREGLTTEGGAVGVGNSTTRSVVISIILIFMANYFLSYLLFLNGNA